MIRRISKVTCVLFIQFVVLSRCYKILLVPIPTNSHVYSKYYIGRELMLKGHEVHLLVHWSNPIPPEWLEEAREGKKLFFHIYGSNTTPKLDIEVTLNDITMVTMQKNLGPEYLLMRLKALNVMLERDILLESGQLMGHLDSLKLDAAVVGVLFYVKYFVLVAHRLRIPLITYSDPVDPWLVRMPWMPSVYRPFMGVEKKSSTFYDRTTNLLMEIKGTFMPPFKDADEMILAKYRHYGDFKNLGELISNSLLFLMPKDPVLDHVRPTTANVINIGGLTTEAIRDSKTTSLPQDYLDFINTENGTNSDIVVVSFGSMVPRYPSHLANIFLKAFSKLLQYKFIWRFENYLNFTIPKNVKIVKWLAQKELLGHSSVKLFITHSGNNGQFEALYQGVPMLALYIMADQPRNARRIVDKGYGEEIDFHTLDEDKLLNNILKIMKNPSYKRKIMKASEIYRSRPDTPGERAAFWIEHVIKFGGDHLKPAGNDLSFWQYMCLDVLLVFELLIIVLMALVIMSLRKLCRLCLKRILFIIDYDNDSRKKEN